MLQLNKGAINWAAALGVGVAAGAAVAVWRYHSPLLQGIAPAQLLSPAPVASNSSSPVASAGPAGSSAATAAGPASAGQPAEVASKPPPKAPEPSSEKEAQRPQFDIVRVEPTGEAVIAGRAAPKSKVAVTDRGQIVAEASADETGQFTVLPPPFAPGGHSLGLTASVDGGEPVQSSGLVAIDVPLPAGKAASGPNTVSASASATTAQPLKSSAQTGAAAPAKSALPAAIASSEASVPAASAPAPRVAVAGVAVEDGGHLVASGAAPPGALLRLYLNGSFLANVTAGTDGRWSLTVEHGMKGGAYAIRADEIDRAKGSVIARAEVPFNYPELVANQTAAAKPPAAASEPEKAAKLETLAPSRRDAASPSPAAAPSSAAAFAGGSSSNSAPASASPASAAPQAAAVIQPPTGAANAVVSNVDTTKVVPGDSLWRISSHVYGNGIRYKQIYAANAAQIRDPRLIYPGQIFVLPHPPAF